MKDMRVGSPRRAAGRTRVGLVAVAVVTLITACTGADDDEGTDDLIDEIREKVASRIGKFARPKRIIWAGDLPKTRSGKIMRRILRKIAEDEFGNLGDTSTLADPAVVDDLVNNRQNKKAGAKAGA